MENRLKKLFDYHRFENNAKLSQVIENTERRFSAELSECELEMVSAAGEFEVVSSADKLRFVPI